MTRSRATWAKRQRQEQKRAKARAKEERRDARHSAPDDPLTVPVEASEPELLEELASLHRALESGEVELQEFEDRRDHIRTQLENLQ